MITGDFVNGLHLMVGLSTDSKPDTTSENTFFLEENTGKVYYFSEGEWAEAGADVAGIVAALLNKGALPAVTATDNGKVLGVENGAWEKMDAPSGGKTLAQMGFITNLSTINVMNGTAPDYRISISSGYGQDYVPEAGSLLIVRAPSSGIAARATLKFAVGSNKYTQSWPINLAGGPIYDGYVNANEIVLLSFNGNRFYVASVVRDPVTVPTKLSDLENDLDLSGIKIIDATAMATSLHGLLSLVKSGITGASGQKTVLFTSNSFLQLVFEAFNAFSSDKLPVLSLGLGFYLPVVDTGGDGDDNVWFTVRMQETETVGTTVTGYTHQITILTVGVVIQTTKTAIEVQPLPSA